MACKTRLFNDDEALEQIILAPEPRVAKALGRTVRNFEDNVWKANARRFVTEGNIEKFKQNPELLEFLLGTGDAILVEAAPRDVIFFGASAWAKITLRPKIHQHGAVRTYLDLRLLMQDGP